jgi:hypothetical protein
MTNDRDRLAAELDRAVKEQNEALIVVAAANDLAETYGRVWAKDSKYYAFTEALARLSEKPS